MTRTLIVDGLKEVIANGRSSSMHAISNSTDYTHKRIVGYAHSLEDASLFAAAQELRDALNGFVLNERHLNDEHFAGVQARLLDLARTALSKSEATQ